MGTSPPQHMARAAGRRGRRRRPGGRGARSWSRSGSRCGSCAAVASVARHGDARPAARCPLVRCIDSAGARDYSERAVRDAVRRREASSGTSCPLRHRPPRGRPTLAAAAGPRHERSHQRHSVNCGLIREGTAAMHTRIAVALVGLLAALAMALGTASSSASALSVSNQLFRITWSQMRFFQQIRQQHTSQEAHRWRVLRPGRSARRRG